MIQVKHLFFCSWILVQPTDWKAKWVYQVQYSVCSDHILMAGALLLTWVKINLDLTQ